MSIRPDWTGRDLALLQDQDRVRVYSVVLHRLSCRLGLHQLLKGVHVGDLEDQADPLRTLWIIERSVGDALRAEELVSFGRLEPMVDVINLVENDVRSHGAFPFPERSFAARGPWPSVA